MASKQTSVRSSKQQPTMQDMTKLQSMIEEMTKLKLQMEEMGVIGPDMKMCEPMEDKTTAPYEGKQQTVYIREPASAKTLHDANTVKCITWSYTLSPDRTSALVTYAGAIFNKYDKFHDNGSVCTDAGDCRTISSIHNHKDATSQYSTKYVGKPSKFNKKGLHDTAMERYKYWPVTFTVNFSDTIKYRPTIENVTRTRQDGSEYSRLKTSYEPYSVSREEQVLHEVKKMLADGVNGGCSSRKRMSPEEKKEKELQRRSGKMNINGSH